MIPAGSKPAWLHGLFHLYEIGKKEWALALLPRELSSVCSSKNQHLPFILQGQVPAPLLFSPHLSSFCSTGSLALVSQPQKQAHHYLWQHRSALLAFTSSLWSPLQDSAQAAALQSSTMLHTGTIIWPQSHTQLKRHKSYSLCLFGLKSKLTMQTFKLKLHKIHIPHQQIQLCYANMHHNLLKRLINMFVSSPPLPPTSASSNIVCAKLWWTFLCWAGTQEVLNTEQLRMQGYLKAVQAVWPDAWFLALLAHLCTRNHTALAWTFVNVSPRYSGSLLRPGVNLEL